MDRSPKIEKDGPVLHKKPRKKLEGPKLKYIRSCAPIGAWEVKLETMTDRPIDQQTNQTTNRPINQLTNHPTDRRTDRVGGEFHRLKIWERTPPPSLENKYKNLIKRP